MKLVLTGFMGSGKSWLLDFIASSDLFNDHELIDLDEFIFKENSLTEDANLGELIERVGFEEFRNLESLSLETIIQNNNQFIVSLGGGSLESELVKNLIRNNGIHKLFLDVDFATCWQRIRLDKSRPLVRLGESHLQNLFNKRKRDYNDEAIVLSQQDISNLTHDSLKKILAECN